MSPVPVGEVLPALKPPTTDTTASLPATAGAKSSTDASADAHSTASAQAPPASAGRPDREHDTTSQPASVSFWQTRCPMKPEPPKTVTRSADACAASASSTARIAHMLPRKSSCGAMLTFMHLVEPKR